MCCPKCIYWNQLCTCCDYGHRSVFDIKVHSLTGWVRSANHNAPLIRWVWSLFHKMLVSAAAASMCASIKTIAAERSHKGQHLQGGWQNIIIFYLLRNTFFRTWGGAALTLMSNNSIVWRKVIELLIGKTTLIKMADGFIRGSKAPRKSVTRHPANQSIINAALIEGANETERC